MYSMVLMAALTTSTDLPDFGRRGWGCCGCYGGYGWGCYGYGGWGGWGGYARGGWGGGWGGGYGGWGGGYGGAWGGWGGYGVWSGVGGIVAAPPLATYASPVLVSNISSTPTTTSLYYAPDPNANRRAKVIVHLPAKAKLKVDGKATRSTSATRRFVSPPLARDQGYHYVFQAEIQRDGEPVMVTKRVDVRAGQTREITLRFPESPTDERQTVEHKQASAARRLSP